MEQNTLRMVKELNKLIVNELLTAGGIYLPEIGSLSVEQSETASARRTVVYTTVERHTSLVAVIALQTKCSVEQSSALYAKWLDAVKQNLQIEIEGIGIVRGGRFEVSSVIEARLNPIPAMESKVAEAAKPIAKKERVVTPKVKSPSKPNGRWRGCAAAAVVIAAAVALASTIFKSDETAVEVKAVAVKKEVVKEAVVKEEATTTPMVKLTPATPIDTAEKEVAGAVKEEEAIAEVAPTPTPEKSSVGELTSRKAKQTPNSEAIEILNKTMAASQDRPATKYKVVYGVYRSKSNAGRAIVDAEEQNQDPQLVCGVTLRDGNYMVTLFESDHFYTSVNFMKRNDQYFSNSLWVYDPEKM